VERRVGDAGVVRVAGELDIATLAEFEGLLEAVLAERPRWLVRQRAAGGEQGSGGQGAVQPEADDAAAPPRPASSRRRARSAQGLRRRLAVPVLVVGGEATEVSYP